ncbi:MAG: alpha/beta fold hydrolase [Sandaracinaceae bacterium]|nr:alpha/beta fold hydrolase [Sandaracinaceae bacterium]
MGARFQSDTVASVGAQLHLDLLACDGARACVVFMPGTNAYALLYGEFLVALAEQGVHVVGFDPRGHGRSSGARGSYTLEELLSDMDAVVHFARERFGVPVFVAGSSQGGITALYYAASGATVSGAICHNIADLSQPESARLMRSPRLGRLLRPHMARLARLFPELPVPMSAYLDLRAEPVRGAGTGSPRAVDRPADRALRAPAYAGVAVVRAVSGPHRARAVPRVGAAGRR